MEAHSRDAAAPSTSVLRDAASILRAQRNIAQVALTAALALSWVALDSGPARIGATCVAGIVMVRYVMGAHVGAVLVYYLTILVPTAVAIYEATLMSPKFLRDWARLEAQSAFTVPALLIAGIEHARQPMSKWRCVTSGVYYVMLRVAAVGIASHRLDDAETIALLPRWLLCSTIPYAVGLFSTLVCARLSFFKVTEMAERLEQADSELERVHKEAHDRSSRPDHFLNHILGELKRLRARERTRVDRRYDRRVADRGADETSLLQPADA